MSKAYRGVDKFYVAKVLTDNATELTYGTPYRVEAVQHVTREEPEESAKIFGDNKALIVVNGQGDSTATFTTLCLLPDDLAKLLGQPTVGKAMVSTNNPEQVTFGIMYRLKNTDGTYEYVALSKAKFSAPSEDVETENDGTDSSLMELVANLIPTEHEFTIDGKASVYKYLKIAEDETENFETAFFSEMQTPVTIETIGGTVATPVATPSSGEVTSGTEVALTCSTQNASIYYTTDGTTPTAESSLYTTAIAVTQNMTIKAIGIKQNYESSVELESTYTV